MLTHLCVFPADDVAPYFKTEPVRTQMHLEGNRLVLTCMAEGSWPLEFKWLHNSRELTKFSLEYRQVSRAPWWVVLGFQLWCHQKARMPEIWGCKESPAGKKTPPPPR